MSKGIKQSQYQLKKEIKENKEKKQKGLLNQLIGNESQSEVEIEEKQIKQIKESKQSKTSKQIPQKKEIEKIKEPKDIKSSKYHSKELKQLKDMKEIDDIETIDKPKELKQTKDSKEIKQIKENQKQKELKEIKQPKEIKKETIQQKNIKKTKQKEKEKEKPKEKYIRKPSKSKEHKPKEVDIPEDDKQKYFQNYLSKYKTEKKEKFVRKSELKEKDIDSLLEMNDNMNKPSQSKKILKSNENILNSNKNTSLKTNEIYIPSQQLTNIMKTQQKNVKYTRLKSTLIPSNKFKQTEDGFDIPINKKELDEIREQEEPTVKFHNQSFDEEENKFENNIQNDLENDINNDFNDNFINDNFNDIPNEINNDFTNENLHLKTMELETMIQQHTTENNNQNHITLIPMELESEMNPTTFSPLVNKQQPNEIQSNEDDIKTMHFETTISPNTNDNENDTLKTMQLESDLPDNNEPQQTQILSPSKHRKRNGHFNNTVFLPKNSESNEEIKGQSTLILVEELFGDNENHGSEESFSLYSGLEESLMDEIPTNIDNEMKNILPTNENNTVNTLNNNNQITEIQNENNNNNNTTLLEDNTSLLDDRSSIPEELKRMGTITSLGQMSFEHFSRLSLPKSPTFSDNNQNIINNNTLELQTNEMKEEKKEQQQKENIIQIKKIAENDENSEISNTTQSSKLNENTKKPIPMVMMNQSNMNETEILKMYMNHYLETTSNDKSIALNSLFTLVNEIAKEHNIQSSIQNTEHQMNQYNYQLSNPFITNTNQLLSQSIQNEQQDEIFVKLTHEITVDKTRQKRIFCEMIEEEKVIECVQESPRYFLKEYEKERIEFPIDPPTIQTPQLSEDMDEDEEHQERQLTNPNLRNDEYFHLKEHCRFIDYISIVPLQSQVNWKSIELNELIENNEHNENKKEIEKKNKIDIEDEIILASRLFFGLNDNFAEEYTSNENEKMKIVQ